jgi:hypothetical protein
MNPVRVAPAVAPMKRSAVRSTSLALLLVAGACHPERVAGPDAIGDLVVSVREVHPRNAVREPTVSLGLATERIYGSISAHIEAQTGIDGRTITIWTHRVVEPPLGLTQVGPATYYVTIPATDGEYTLRVLRRGRETDEYKLVMTTAALELRPIRTRFTRASPVRAWRYPRRSFVVACVIKAFLSTGSLERCDEFRASLLAALSLERIEFGENGELPYYYLASQSSPGYELRAEYYRYAAEEDFAQVGAVIRAHGERYPGASAWARNWRNEAHHSWLP